MPKYVIINEHDEIFLENAEQKLSSAEKCKQVLTNMRLNDEFVLETTLDEEIYIVEAFDFPIKVHTVSFEDHQLFIHTNFNLKFLADPAEWRVDSDDEFYGLTTSRAPFKLTLKAQTQLFNLCDEYDDESFTVQGMQINTPSYFHKNDDVNSAYFWNQSYKKEISPNWDLNEPAEAFKDMLQRLKFPKSRILVLGCGAGHDAAFFAKVGHVVTAVDFSLEAIELAKSKYGHISNLSFECMDVFNLPQDWNFSFDVIIEHTLFCAIAPEQRKNLVTVWKRLLHEEGQLMSVLFTMFKRSGPPYGATEMEIRSLLQPHFQFLFWGRLRNSIPSRLGKELFVLGKKR